MNKFLDALITALAIIFIVPTGLILASWNTLPGDSLYTTKRGFEGAALAVTIKTPLAQKFSLKFTDRRFSEATKLLDKKGSTVGYTILVAEAEQSKNLVIEKNDSQAVTQLIQNIETYQKGIEEKKVAIETEHKALTSAPILQPTNQAFQTPEPTVLAPTIQPTVSQPVQTTSDLNKANDDLEKIKKELENKSKKDNDKHNPENEKDNPKEKRDKN